MKILVSVGLSVLLACISGLAMAAGDEYNDFRRQLLWPTGRKFASSTPRERVFNVDESQRQFVVENHGLKENYYVLPQSFIISQEESGKNSFLLTFVVLFVHYFIN